MTKASPNERRSKNKAEKSKTIQPHRMAKMIIQRRSDFMFCCFLGVVARICRFYKETHDKLKKRAKGGIKMNKMQQIEAHFRELNEEVIKAYEEELKDLREQQKGRSKKLKEDEKEVRDILRDSGVAVDRLEELEHKDVQDLKNYLKEVRPKLIGRPTRMARDFKESSVVSWISSQAHSSLANEARWRDRCEVLFVRLVICHLIQVNVY
jgi:hypothetical protein